VTNARRADSAARGVPMSGARRVGASTLFFERPASSAKDVCLVLPVFTEEEEVSLIGSTPGHCPVPLSEGSGFPLL
jgi:hypothetical protein